VIDVNRPPDNTPLYPGQWGAGLTPTETFAGEAVYQAAETPDEAEIADRRERYWRPYHAALALAVASALDRLRRRPAVGRPFDQRRSCPGCSRGR
jgi:N-formylglutamate deformylase